MTDSTRAEYEESYVELLPILQVTVDHHEDNVESDNEGHSKPSAKMCVAQTVKLNRIEVKKLKWYYKMDGFTWIIYQTFW